MCDFLIFRFFHQKTVRVEEIGEFFFEAIVVFDVDVWIKNKSVILMLFYSAFSNLIQELWAVSFAYNHF